MSAAHGTTSISAIIVSHNEGENLRRTVDSLLAGLPSDGEVVVVDDYSTDGSAGAVSSGYLGVSVVRPAERLGVAPARNFGAARARGEVLVFSDAHVEAPLGWAGPLRDALVDPAVGAVGPVVSALHRPEAKAYGFRWADAALNLQWLGRQGNEPHPVPMLVGCFVALRRDTFAATGGFDPGLAVYGSEDAELCLRLWTLGYECRLVPALDVGHLFREAHPYRVEWEVVLHNLLRVAVVHFGPARLQRLVACLASHAAFPAAFARLVEGDAWARRAAVRAARRFDDDWFFRRFGMDG